MGLIPPPTPFFPKKKRRMCRIWRPIKRGTRCRIKLYIIKKIRQYKDCGWYKIQKNENISPNVIIFHRSSHLPSIKFNVCSLAHKTSVNFVVHKTRFLALTATGIQSSRCSLKVTTLSESAKGESWYLRGYRNS